MNRASIDYDPKTNCLLVSAPYFLLGRTRNIPNRKWHPPTKSWRAPLIKRNAEYMLEALADAEFSDLARAAIDNLLTTVEKSLEPRAGQFPADYQFKTLPLHEGGEKCTPEKCRHMWKDTYQYRAISRAYRLPQVAIHAGCGTGKSWIAIQSAVARYQAGRAQACLFVTRSNGKSSVEEHWNEHCPIGYSLHSFDSANMPAALRWLERIKRGDKLPVLLVSVESFQSSTKASDIAKLFLHAYQCFVVLDESSKIKTHSAHRSKVVVELGQLAAERMTMTGTPITQGIRDLFMQFQFLNPNVLGIGDYYSFDRRYMVYETLKYRDGTEVMTKPTKEGSKGTAIRKLVGYDHMDELMETIKPWIIQITKDEAMPDLPPKVKKTVNPEMSPEQRRLYKELRSGLGANLLKGGRLEPKGALDLMLRLQQIAGGFYTVEGEPIVREGLKPKRVTTEVKIEGTNPKLDALLETIETIEGSVIVWARFVPEVEMIVKALRAKYGHDQVVDFYGKVSEEDRTKNRHRFQSGASRFFVGTPQSGGMAITLTMAEAEIFFSNGFSAEDREQAESRAWGRGNVRKSILSIDILLRGSVDRLVASALAYKMDVAKFVETRVGEQEVRELLQWVA